MPRVAPAVRARHNLPAFKAKVKSGCKTCKSRKVKCDEGRPACHRCTSTGRICEGYGIWGGGNYCGSQSAKETSMILQQPASPISLMPTSGMPYIEWFKCRVAPKIPGSFLSRFWNTLVLQASIGEPAVLHAVLAMSSLHKTETLNSCSQVDKFILKTEQDLFPVKQYVKAIEYLRSHLALNDRSSSRVTLITCVIFVALELLRGHFRVAQTHLQNGINILKQMHIKSGQHLNIKSTDYFRDTYDDWISEIISRLHLQVQLFKHIHLQQNVDWPIDTGPSASGLVFHSTKEAWYVLEGILRRIFQLGHDSRQLINTEQSQGQVQQLALVERQNRVVEELAQWKCVHEASRESMQRHMTKDELNGARVPLTYNILATIMVHTCLETDNEMLYDNYNDLFSSIVCRLADAWGIILTIVPSVHPLPGHRVDMAISIMDVGWIPPLYYTAIKCRNHRIRLQAVRLLECTSHREGLWDASIAAVISRKVIELEERGFYRDSSGLDDFSLTSHPQPEDLLLPVLPNSYRLSGIDVEILGDPIDQILLFCKRAQEGKDCRVLLSEYSLKTQYWVDNVS